jgi:serine/threonine-protein phosphatase CPPED1
MSRRRSIRRKKGESIDQLDPSQDSGALIIDEGKTKKARVSSIQGESFEKGRKWATEHLRGERHSSGFSKQLFNRTVNHPLLPQDDSSRQPLPFSFVIGADTQFGISTESLGWEYEKEYSERAVQYVNSLDPKPAFICLCGDLIDMEVSIFESKYDRETCLKIQQAQYDDFQRIWSTLDPTIPCICLCGNHDVGNRPTPESIERYTSRFGEDYFAFWYRGCYFVCLNTNLYNDNSGALDIFNAQQEWLERRFQSAREANAKRVFLLGHHPWFLTHEGERDEDLIGRNYLMGEKSEQFVPDSYFPIRLALRKPVMDLCRMYNVDACFAGHYHQNLIARSSWGMPMIVTGAICNWNITSTAKDSSIPENGIVGAGVRVVTIDDSTPSGFTHAYHLI